MNKPEMILFDYGGTLIYEPDFEPYNGNKAIYPYISENPHNVSLEEFSSYLLNLFDEIRGLRGELIEIHEHIFLRNVLEHFDMKLSVSFEEAEWIIWNGISRGVATPEASEMLASLREKGIRTGIISISLIWRSANQACQRTAYGTAAMTLKSMLSVHTEQDCILCSLMIGLFRARYMRRMMLLKRIFHT